MIANPDNDFADPSQSHTTAQHPCDSCRQSKLKCDQHRPTCDTCRKRDKACTYSTADGYADGRVRRFHRRSRNGCSHCKTRRVRCDEQKPICGGCKRKGAEDMCIYPTDQGRSSRSKSPTTSAHFSASIPTQSNFEQNSSIPIPDLSSTNLDYFAQLQTTQSAFNMNPANNAMSVWNPVTSTPSPSSLLTSLFGPQAVDVFQPQSQPQPQPTFDYQEALRQTASYPPMPSAQIDFSYNDILPPKSPDIRWANGFNWNGHDLATLQEKERISRDMGSSESTPISLNSDTAFNSTFALVQPEYRDRPEHPSYLYQLQVLEQPDQLAQFFPSLEQRHQFRHFFHKTSESLLVVPTTQSTNPFLCHFSHLALGAPAGQSIAHDAFRLALLSLASVDFGIKMDQSGPSMGDNAMYATSDEQRSESFKRLRACSVAGIFKEDPNDVDLGIATVVALNIRDRLAGCQDWELPLRIGQTIIEEAGGPAALINARPTADRRFLVEQMAILELIGHLTIWVSPRIFTWDNEWFRYHETGEGIDHIQSVYGWTREAALYSARTMILCGEARDVDAMREAQPKPIYRQLKTIIESRMMSLVKRVKEFIPQGDLIRHNVLLGTLPREVTVGVMGIVGCMDLCLRTVIIMDDIKSQEVQTVVTGILDISEESMSRGHYAGLLLPLSWADGVAHGPVIKARAKALLKGLKGHYHLNQALLELIVNIDWALLNNLALHDWEAFLRRHGFYVPCF